MRIPDRAELCALYNRCVMPEYRVREEAFDGLTDGAEIWTEYAGEHPVGCAVLRKSSLTLLLTDPSFRGRGIGSSLLAKAEAYAKFCGFSRLTAGYGDDYVIQGVPDDTVGWRFLEKRGYISSGFTWDMSLTLPGKHIEPPDGVEFCLNTVTDEVLAAVKAVDSSWMGVYRTTDEDVLTAYLGGKLAGFCIPSAYSRYFHDRTAGSVSCVGVLPQYRGRGIGLAMVSEALRILSEDGCTRAEILCTSIPDWYGKLGFVPLHRVVMCAKNL